MKKKIAILGSTGSIGKQTLKIIKKDKKNFDVVLLSTNKNTKLILVPEYTDDQNNFILFDIKPRGVKPVNREYAENYRFAYEYDNPKDIINGLVHFKKTYEFVNKEELSPEPIRKQKRNDDENSNHR